MGEMAPEVNWSTIKSKIAKITEQWLSLPHYTTNSIREFLRFNLGLRNGSIHHPIFGEMKLTIRGSKTNHFNISFSKTVDYEDNWDSKKLLQTFGYQDKNGHRFALRRRISLLDKNNDGQLGLIFNRDKVELWGNNILIGKWDLLNIISTFESKGKALVFDYELDKERGLIKFSNPKIVILNRSFLELNLPSLIKSGQISPEFRMFMGESHAHCIERNISPNSVKDYGFGWRLKASEKSEIYIWKKLNVN
jgi:hypothetical protein